MNRKWLQTNDFHPISTTVYLKDVELAKARHLDAHVNLTFENTQMQRCDLHGTIRLVSDGLLVRMGPNPTAVGRAIWVYSDKTWRSPSNLKHWLGKECQMTYASLKSACRELAEVVREWEREVGFAHCEVLKHDKATAQKIAMIGVGDN
jgi:hypothetical protein